MRLAKSVVQPATPGLTLLMCLDRAERVDDDAHTHAHFMTSIGTRVGRDMTVHVHAIVAIDMYSIKSISRIIGQTGTKGAIKYKKR